MVDGRYRTGIVIAMASGSHTYWKQPGDAGVPPVFAFNGSTNIAKAEVLFPAPKRISEEGLDAFGYTDRVVFPVMVMPADPSKPSKLHVDLSYAVCNKICIPAHSTADLNLPVPPGSAEDAEVAAALATVPAPLHADDQRDLVVTPVVGAKKPTWTIHWSGKRPLTDIFAEAPDGYAFDTKADSVPETWTLVASEAAPAPSDKAVPVTLTLAATPQNYVTTPYLQFPSAPRP